MSIGYPEVTSFDQYAAMLRAMYPGARDEDLGLTKMGLSGQAHISGYPVFIHGPGETPFYVGPNNVGSFFEPYNFNIYEGAQGPVYAGGTGYHDTIRTHGLPVQTAAQRMGGHPYGAAGAMSAAAGAAGPAGVAAPANVLTGSKGEVVFQTPNGVMIDGSLWWGHSLDSINSVWPGLLTGQTGPPSSAPGNQLGAFLQQNPGGFTPGKFGGGAPPGAKTGPGANDPASAGARAALNATLARFGLEGLGEWAWQQYLNGIPIEQILLDMRQQPAYKARFPYMEALAKRGRAITEAAAIDMERSYAQVSQQYGLPKGFYDSPDDFRRYIENDIAPTEYRDRLAAYSEAAMEFASLPDMASTASEMQRLYGVSSDSGAFLAWFIDPDKALPIIQRTVGAAAAGAGAQRAGFGALTRPEAERLQGLGVTGEQSAAGFAELVNDRELFGVLPGEEQYTQLGTEFAGARASGAIGRGEQIGAQFGSDANARRRIEAKRRRRQATFEGGGGGYAGGRQGLAGLGTAGT